MPFAVQTGSKILGTSKRKKGKTINKILADAYKKEHNVRISKIITKRKRKKRKKK